MGAKPAIVHKRAQIAAENKTMFIWVAGVSVILGFAVVISIFLVQMLFFNERVLSEKNKTIQTLIDNEAKIPTLESHVRALDANQALIDSRASTSDRAVQVILDALPSSPNSEALGASLQGKLLAGIDGLVLNSLQVDSVSDSSTEDSLDVLVGSNEIPFSFSVSGDETVLKKVLTNLEISIRTIKVTSLKIESQNNIRTLSAQAKAFYEPAVTVGLKDKVVK